MTRLSISVYGELVRQGLQDLDAEIPQIGALQIYRRLLHARTRLRQPGRKPAHPLQWVNPKQRKAFFASDGFGGGIPHVRRGSEKAWQLTKIENGWMLINSTSGAKWIWGDAYGQDQSKLLVDSWPLSRNIVEDEIGNLPEAIADQIMIVSRRKGF